MKQTATKPMGRTAPKAGGSRPKAAPIPTSNGDAMLTNFFVEELKDIYWAEKNGIKSLPRLKKATTTEELQQVFMDHIEVTKVQVERLENIFEILGKKPQAKKCEAMEGLMREAEDVIENTEEGTATRDVALIMAAQKMEHYEIATYGGLATLARTLGYDEIVDLLEQTLDEEKEADQLLTEVAENDINYEAAEEDEEQEDEE